jgi:ribonucrease Y
MTSTVLLLEGAVTFVLGGATGYVIRHYVAKSLRGSLEAELEEKTLQAKRDARAIEDEALSRASALREELKRNEDRISKQEERLDRRENELLSKESQLEKELESLKQKGKELEVGKERLLEKESLVRKGLEKVANLSEGEAREKLFAKIIKESEEDLQSRVLKLARDGEVRLLEKAQDILVSSIYRIANGPIAQFMTSVVEIEDDEIKGKVIGKEGRNIKAFERLAGVELLVDENPHGIAEQLQLMHFRCLSRMVVFNQLRLKNVLIKQSERLVFLCERRGKKPYLSVAFFLFLKS